MCQGHADPVQSGELGHFGLVHGQVILHVPRSKTGAGDRAFTVTAPILPLALQQARSTEIFKETSEDIPCLQPSISDCIFLPVVVPNCA